MKNKKSKFKIKYFEFLIIPSIFISLIAYPSASGLAGNKDDGGEDAAHYMIQGRIQYDNHNYDRAAELYDKALALDPNNKEALKYQIRAVEKFSMQNRGAIYKPPFERKAQDAPGSSAIVKPPRVDKDAPVFEAPKKEALSLEDALDIGMKNHLPVQIAQEQVKLAGFKERESFRELFPQATLRWDETSGIVSTRDYTGRKYNLKVQHPLYHGGELRNTWEQARVNLRIANENYSKTKEDYTLELIKAYYDYAKTARNFEVQEKLFKELEGDISIAKKEHEQGITGLVEFLNIQLQYNQAYYSYLSSENTLVLARSNLLQLMNLDREPNINLKVDQELVFKEIRIDLEDCIELAYANRSDLRINELSLKAAELGENVARSQQAPKIDLTGTIGKSGEAFTPGDLELSNEYFVGAKVNVPWGPNSVNYSFTKENIAPSLTVFQPTKNDIHSVRFNILDNLGSYTETKRTQITRQQAYADLIKGKQTAATQVREAYFNYQESALKVKNSMANRDLYQKELLIVKEKRMMNETQTQDVVAAKIKLASEEANLNSAIAENIVAVAKLNKAVGMMNYFKLDSSGLKETSQIK
ncbi:MAG: TolC family protein, partial [Candidatus Omnitrophica bacterium]|nr:TolC family protein [Candidatus Omnitrophota bacterium]